jgi:hypothetical protein
MNGTGGVQDCLVAETGLGSHGGGLATVIEGATDPTHQSFVQRKSMSTRVHPTGGQLIGKLRSIKELSVAKGVASSFE